MTTTSHRVTQSLFVLLSAMLLLAPLSLATSATSLMQDDAGSDTSLLQDDAESGTDAPNDCVAGSPSSLDLIHDGTYGELVHIDDPRDVYTITVKNGQTVDVVQSLPPDDSANALHAPHAPHLPYGIEALHDDTANPFGLEVRGRDCVLIERSDDPAVLPRTITLDSEGVYQIVLFETGGTTITLAQMGARDNNPGAAMCHPPCTANGYLIEGILA